MAEARVFQAVHRALLRNRRGAGAEAIRARFADRVTTQAELRWQRLDLRHLWSLGAESRVVSLHVLRLVDCICVYFT